MVFFGIVGIVFMMLVVVCWWGKWMVVISGLVFVSVFLWNVGLYFNLFDMGVVGCMMMVLGVLLFV